MLLFGTSAAITSGATLNVSVHCLSINIERSDQVIGDQSALIEFASDGTFNPFNGELAPHPFVRANEVRGFYHFGFPGKEITDDFVLGLPVGADSNANGVDDFFEPALPVESTTTSGLFEDPTGAGRIGSVFATWSRDAGATSGSCVMQFDTSLSLSIWHLNFRILVLSGTLDYARNGTNVVGTVALQDERGHSLTGKMRLGLVDADHGSVRSASWTSGETKSVMIEPLGPLKRSGFHYVGKFLFSDGELATPFADYRQWILLITDPNDVNANSVPDFTDLTESPHPVKLAIGKKAEDFLLTLEGETGSSYELESSLSLRPALWQRVRSLTLTNALHTMTLPRPANSITFWRIRVP